jgi:hypothetical protein
MFDFLKNLRRAIPNRRDRQNRELEEYRHLMLPPDVFEDGFNWKTVVGAVFLGFVMMPGSMYLGLVVGTGATINAAAQWVTIILFAEVARRSFKDLKRQEVYILYYMAGIAMGAPIFGMGSPLQAYLWRQYLVQSDFSQAMGIAQEIPSWYAPSAEQIKAAGPTFFSKAWIAPIALTMCGVIITRIDSYGLGYVLYRLTSDVEELPFPMAPVGASGITALVTKTTAEGGRASEAWRWRAFSIGGMIGLVFGAVYIGVPVVTGAILPKPVQLLPIPWVDFTPSLGKYVSATPLILSFDLGSFFVGMVLPFWAVIGSFLGVVFTLILNPVLYDRGILSNWQPGMNFVDTTYINNIDFYLAFGVGLTVAITFISLGRVFRPLFRSLRLRGGEGARDAAGEAERRWFAGVKAGWRRLVTNNVKRGDFSIFIAIGIYCFSSAFWIGLSTWLIEGFPWHFFVIYAVVYTPLISYATAKLEGLCGQTVQIPMVREATYILSGYRGVAIWFAPVPLRNLGVETVNFRILELTGTKIISQIKTLLVTVPIIIVAILIYSELLWKMAPVPSEAYPYAQKMWELQVKNATLTYSSTMEGGSLFMEAWKWKYFSWGIGAGIFAFSFLSTFGLPTLLVFGIVRGLGQSYSGGYVLELLGALVGRFYFRRKFGKMWMKYTPVLLAGFSCGMGLLAMVAMAFTILSKMMAPLLY